MPTDKPLAAPNACIIRQMSKDGTVLAEPDPTEAMARISIDKRRTGRRPSVNVYSSDDDGHITGGKRRPTKPGVRRPGEAPDGIGEHRETHCQAGEM